LLSRVSASQPSVQSKRKTWSQNVIGIVDLDDNTLESRLLPLDLRYLQAVMDAGDEQLQHIENWPGGEAVLLTRLGGLPLAVSRGRLSGRAALRLNEASADLPAFTEFFDQGRNDAARQAAREQRKAGQQASQAQLNADLATAVGMTPEQFAALSDEDRKLVLTMGGNFDAITAAGLKQAASAREADPGAFSMTILDVFEIAGRGVVVTGRVDAGTVRVGDTLCLLSATSGERELQVEAIELGHLSPDSATAGDTPAITFNGIGTGDVSRNDQLRASCGSR
jgi:elongation factor Tu